MFVYDEVKINSSTIQHKHWNILKVQLILKAILLRANNCKGKVIAILKNARYVYFDLIVLT